MATLNEMLSTMSQRMRFPSDVGPSDAELAERKARFKAGLLDTVERAIKNGEEVSAQDMAWYEKHKHERSYRSNG